MQRSRVQPTQGRAFTDLLLSSWLSGSESSESEALGSFRNLAEGQVIRPRHRPAESETWEIGEELGRQQFVPTNPSRDPQTCSSMETTEGDTESVSSSFL